MSKQKDMLVKLSLNSQDGKSETPTSTLAFSSIDACMPLVFSYLSERAHVATMTETKTSASHYTSLKTQYTP